MHEMVYKYIYIFVFIVINTYINICIYIHINIHILHMYIYIYEDVVACDASHEEARYNLALLLLEVLIMKHVQGEKTWGHIQL